MTAVALLTYVQVVVGDKLPVQLQRSPKLKILHRFFLSVSLAHQDLSFCQKYPEQTFFSMLLTRIHLNICLQE